MTANVNRKKVNTPKHSQYYTDIQTIIKLNKDLQLKGLRRNDDTMKNNSRYQKEKTCYAKVARQAALTYTFNPQNCFTLNNNPWQKP